MLRRWSATTVSRSARSPLVSTSTTAAVQPFRAGSVASISSSPANLFDAGPPPPMADIPATAVPSRSFSSKATLLDILAREEREEQDTGNTEMPYELANLRDTIQQSWTIRESGASTDLVRIDNENVRVSFHCQDTLEVVQPESEYFESEEDQEEPSAPVRFTVTVAKGGKSLNFACFSEDGEVKIEGVSTTALSTVDYVHEKQGTLPKIEYQGPDVTELAEDLQEALSIYLEEEYGVNSDIAAFIAMSADYREEINYVDFLKEAQSIIS